VASNIASSFAEATPAKLQVLIATGLVLFAVTFLVNFAARWVVGRNARRMAR
jgi:phosphate transport system permease protein